MEAPIIAGVAHDRSEAKVTVVGVPDRPAWPPQIFEAVRRRRDQHRHDRAERLRRRDRPHRHLVHAAQDRRHRPAVAGAAADPGRGRLRLDPVRRPDRQALAGRRGHALATPASRRRFFKALADAGVNIEMISTSEIRISVITRDDRPRRRGAGRAHGVRPRLDRGRGRRLRGHRPVTHRGCRGRRKPTLAIVGATGAVGTVMLDVLADRADVWGEIRLVASPRSAGRTLRVRGEDVVVAGPDAGGLRRRRRRDVRRPAEVVAPQWAPIAAGAGRRRRRQQRRVPDGPRRAARRPRGQPRARSATGPRGIIANPNCTTLTMIDALGALHARLGAHRARRRLLPGRLRGRAAPG